MRNLKSLVLAWVKAREEDEIAFLQSLNQDQRIALYQYERSNNNQYGW